MDCYDYPGHVVWNLQAGELWRRTTIAINRYIRRLARQRGIPEHRVYYPDKDGNSRSRLVPAWRLSFGKAAEMQRRAVIHFHAIIRLDGNNPADPTAILPPPAELDAQDLVDAVAYAVRTVAFVTGSHRARPVGWLTGWGEQVHTKVITVAADGEVTDGMVAAYLAKYATKSTEVTGHVSGRLTAETVHLYADPDGTHTERLVEACWTLGHAGCVEGPACPDPCQHHTCADIHDPGRVWRRLRRWAHMLGFGGHFLTKSRRYSVTFAILRQQRVVFRRTDATGPDTSDQQPPQKDTTLVVNFLQFVGAGWHTTADALLANTSAALAREHQTLALAEIAAMAV
jgi:hypothetical protein